MSHAVHRSLIGAVIALLVALTGCGGPSDSSSGASSTSSAAQRPVPEPSGPRCTDLGDLAALTELNLIDAVSAVPTATQFAAYLTEHDARATKYAALDSVTVFVPLDDAWTVLSETVVEQLEAASWRQAVVEYSLVPAVYLPEDLTDGAVAMPTFRGPSTELLVSGSADAVIVNGSAIAVCAPVQFAGGVLYFVDALLLPAA